MTRSGDSSAGERPIRRRVERRLQRGVYLLPSLFTTGNMLLGFYALISGLGGHFERACLLVFIAGVLDHLDGRIARMTGTESEFGREYDSLADLFTFGATPALLAYLHGAHELERAGWLAAFFYMACAAVRLARFNVQTRIVDSRFFVGLPSPAAAGAVCSLLYFVDEPHGRPWSLLLIATLVLIGLLMVSTFRFVSFKKINLRERHSYRALLPIIAAGLVALFEPKASFLVAAAIYSASGPLTWLTSKLFPRRAAAMAATAGPEGTDSTEPSEKARP